MRPDELADAGRSAARAVWRLGVREAEVDDPLHPAFADAALDEFSQLQATTPGILREQQEGAELGAGAIDVEPFHGIIEVIQNADDAGASELRLALRSKASAQRLLLAHDGRKPVRLPDAVAMTYAFVSTKREEAYSKGRFGIGLKTLRKLGSTIRVHCGPYHFEVERGRLSAVPPARRINGFFEPAEGETLFELDLTRQVAARNLGAWLERFGTTGLLFLDCVRSVSFVKSRSFDPAVQLLLDEIDGESFELPLGRGLVTCHRLQLSAPGGPTWDRYTSSVPCRAAHQTVARGKRGGPIRRSGSPFRSGTKLRVGCTPGCRSGPRWAGRSA